MTKSAPGSTDRFIGLVVIVLALITPTFRAQDRDPIQPAPARAEGEGPFKRLILRGVNLVNGTGSPMIGPVDIVIEGNRIAQVAAVGLPQVPIDPRRRPKADAGDKELDFTGKYVLPGFIDMHAHIGGRQQGTPAEYVYKLWMAHGVTTIREPGSDNGLEWTLVNKQKSARNEIVAPRIRAYVRFGQGSAAPISSPEQARAWVASVAEKGADGLKLTAHPPKIMAATIDEAKKRGLRTMAHLTQTGMAQMNALDAARLGLTSMEHWLGLAESLFTDRTVQSFPPDYQNSDEGQRFAQSGRILQTAAPPHSEKWNAVMTEMLKLDFTIDPTLACLEPARDVVRARTAEWHPQYTLPSLWEFYKPSRTAHAAFYYYWTTEDEMAWKEHYRLFMTFLNEFKNRGGRVTAGSDSGWSYNLYGFHFIRELELLREAGFHPLEVIQSATMKAAEALGADSELGTVEAGKLADLVVLDENPLQNLQVLYGTGAIRLTAENQIVRAGGVRYTIKDGIVYDAKKLLADVQKMADAAKKAEGYEIVQPGLGDAKKKRTSSSQ